MLLILTLSFFSIYGQDGLIPEKFIIHRVKKGENIINPNYFILQDKLVKKLFEDLKKVKYSHSFPNGYDLMISM